MTHKTSVLNSRRTEFVSIIKSNQSMQFMKTISVYRGNQTETPRTKMLSFLIPQQTVQAVKICSGHVKMSFT